MVKAMLKLKPLFHFTFCIYAGAVSIPRQSPDHYPQLFVLTHDHKDLGDIWQMLKSSPEYLRLRLAIMLSNKEPAKFRDPENRLAKRWRSRTWRGDAVDVAVQRLPLIVTEHDGAWQIWGGSR